MIKPSIGMLLHIHINVSHMLRMLSLYLCNMQMNNCLRLYRFDKKIECAEFTARKMLHDLELNNILFS